MTGKTHLTIGLATGIGTVHYMGADSWLEVGLAVAVSGFASLLPDIDAEKSMLQNALLPKMSRGVRKMIYGCIAIILILSHLIYSVIPLWALLIGIFFGVAAFAPHRTLTHSVLMVVYLGLVVSMISPSLVWPFVAGYASHLIADALTVSGIPFLWPYPKRFSISMLGLRIKTGSQIEQGFFFVAIGCLILGIFYLFV